MMALYGTIACGAGAIPDGIKVFKDLVYVKKGHELQKLDLYIPENQNDKPLPLVIWVHGGGWQKGSKNRIDRNAFILENGFALASIDYRLTSHAAFPAQIHDCKAAVRWLRRNARTFGIDPDRFGIWGASAGGHLVALLGTTNGNEKLEGDLGITGVSSDVQAVCDWFGPTDLHAIATNLQKQSSASNDFSEKPVVKLIGGLENQNLELAKMASPLDYVHEDVPPFLIMHGDQDELVPLSESRNLLEELQKHGVESELIVVPGAAHGFFKEPDLHQDVVNFFKKHLHVKGSGEKKSGSNNLQPDKINPFLGNWALKLPGDVTGWLTIYDQIGELTGELWMVGAQKTLTDVSVSGNRLFFTHRRAVGEREYEGGPATGEKIPCKHIATLSGDDMLLVMDRPRTDGSVEEVSFRGKRIAPLPTRPDLSKVEFGEPVVLFNGKNLDGWILTNPLQTNCWKAVDGILFNDSPKTSFEAFARYGNLRTEKEFTDFNLRIDFNVPEDGNSGIYLRGMYEVQVVDRDSRMQGLHGVGAVFNRILPDGNHGKKGGEWQHYDITLVDRHITVILNGIKVIDNQPVAGCTNGALQADESLPGPIYLQGDHTQVSYRNIILRPVIKK